MYSDTCTNGGPSNTTKGTDNEQMEQAYRRKPGQSIPQDCPEAQ